MARPPYNPDAVVYAALVYDRANGKMSRAAMAKALRKKFTGISDCDIDDAFKDAKLLIAIKQVATKEEDE